MKQIKEQNYSLDVALSNKIQIKMIIGWVESNLFNEKVVFLFDFLNL